jgi:uncharacterized protein
MIRIFTRSVLLLAGASVLLQAAPAVAQQQPAYVQAISGTRLDIVATGQVNRVPDVARINAGVVTQAQTATEALRQNAERMTAVRAALRRAGIADRDIQTSSINLHPEYRYEERRTPELIGYRASNEVTVRFRDIAQTGRILDALVAEGANQINGPMLMIDKPEQAMDEARTAALATARARADLYSRAMGMRVRRIVSVSEGGGMYPAPPPVMAMAARGGERGDIPIDPGEQTVGVTLSVSFELE